VLKWDGAKYTPATISGGSSSLATLTDVQLGTPNAIADGNIL